MLPVQHTSCYNCSIISTEIQMLTDMMVVLAKQRAIVIGRVKEGFYMSNPNRILWVTRTAIFIALLITLQSVTRPMGQYVTGSLVNLVLILSVTLSGLWSGVTVALLSPVFAFLLGIGPALPPVVLFIMLGNLSLAIVWSLIAGQTTSDRIMCALVVSAVVGAAVKCLVLYFGIVKFAVPVLLKLPDPQATVVSASFSLPQLVTASIGGAVAVLLTPLLRKAIRRSVN